MRRLICVIFLTYISLNIFAQNSIEVGKYNKKCEKIGTWVEYFICENDSTVKTIKSIIKYKRGLMHGKFIENYDDCDKTLISMKGRYRRDKLHGKLIKYDSEGRVGTVVKFKNGESQGCNTYNYL